MECGDAFKSVSKRFIIALMMSRASEYEQLVIQPRFIAGEQEHLTANHRLRPEYKALLLQVVDSTFYFFLKEC